MLLASATLAVAATTGTALFLTHDRAGKRLVTGGDFPRKLLGVLHGSLLSGVKVHNAKNISASMYKCMSLSQTENSESSSLSEVRTARQEGAGGGMPSRPSVGILAASPENLEGGTEQKFPFPFLNFSRGAQKKNCKGKCSARLPPER